MFRRLAALGVVLTGILAASAIFSPLFATCSNTGSYPCNSEGTTENGILVALTQLVSGGVTGISLADASIGSASGASETVAAASASRKTLIVANPSTTTWWINPSGGTAAANCAGCFELPAGAYWSPHPAPTNIVKGIGTAASKLTVAGG